MEGVGCAGGGFASTTTDTTYWLCNWSALINFCRTPTAMNKQVGGGRGLCDENMVGKIKTNKPNEIINILIM